MDAALRLHDECLRRTFRPRRGYEVKTEGDAFMVAFQNVSDAVLWCLTCQVDIPAVSFIVVLVMLI